MKNRNRLGLSALGALLTASLVAGCVPPEEPPDPPAEPGVVRELLTPAYVGDVSADGRFIATAGPGEVVLHDREAGTAIRHAHDRSPDGAAVSDDGRYVAFRHLSATGIGTAPTASIWDTDTGQVAPVPSLGADATGSRPAASLSADGRYLTYAQGDRCDSGGCSSFVDIYSNLFTFDRVTGQTTQLTHFDAFGDTFDGAGRIVDYHTLGDGSAIIYSRATRAEATSEEFTELVRWDRASGTETVLAVPTGDASGITASYDGSRIAYQHSVDRFAPDARYSVQLITTDPLDPSGYPQTGIEQQGYPSLSADGSMLFFAAGGSVQGFDPYLEPQYLVAVALDGSFTERRQFTDEEFGSDLRPLEAVLLDGEHAAVYRMHDEEFVYSMSAWLPR